MSTLTKPDFVMETFIACTHDALWDALTRADLIGQYHFACQTVAGDATAPGDTIDYSVVRDRLHDLLRNNKLQLLEAFAEALGKEERTRKVLVVRPGAVDTPLWQKVSMRLPKGAWQAVETTLGSAAAFAVDPSFYVEAREVG